MTTSALNHLSHAQMAVIAKRSLSGESYVEMEGAYGLTYEEITRLIKRQAFKDIMASEQGYFDWVKARMLTKMALEGEDYVDRMQATSRDVSNPNLSFQATKFLIDKILPTTQRVISENRTQVNIDADVIIQAVDRVSEVLTAIKGANASDYSAYTLTGTEGIETAEPDAGTPTGSNGGVSGPIGSGNHSESVTDGKPEPPEN